MSPVYKLHNNGLHNYTLRVIWWDGRGV